MQRFTFLFFFAVVGLLSCGKDKAIVPTNYFALGDSTFNIESTYYIDYGVSEGEYDMEFYWFDKGEEVVEQCVLTEGNCEVTAFLIDVYNDETILQDGIYNFDDDYDGANYAFGEIAFLNNEEEEYFEIVSGTVTITGTSTDNLKIMVEGIAENGQNVVGEFSGGYTDLAPLFDDFSSNGVSLKRTQSGFAKSKSTNSLN